MEDGGGDQAVRVRGCGWVEVGEEGFCALVGGEEGSCCSRASESFRQCDILIDKRRREFVAMAIRLRSVRYTYTMAVSL